MLLIFPLLKLKDLPIGSTTELSGILNKKKLSTLARELVICGKQLLRHSFPLGNRYKDVVSISKFFLLRRQ